MKVIVISAQRPALEGQRLPPFWVSGRRVRHRASISSVSTNPTFVAKCPWRIGIVSTGLIINGDDNGERGALAKKFFGVMILDEAHKARAARQTLDGKTTTKRNNLLDFLHKAALNAGNVILGTATPIQLDAVELWDPLEALNQGAPQVLGTPFDGGEWIRDVSDRRAALAI